jgi:type IV fimbrial biogenesis protein FimT
MVPHNGQHWSDGWIITSGCGEKHIKAACLPKPWLSQGGIFPLYFKNPGFSDPHSQQKGIQFNAAGAAKTGQGGFVANRLILGHRHYSDLERQLILGSGGRWRICNPEVDRKACK